MSKAKKCGDCQSEDCCDADSCICDQNNGTHLCDCGEHIKLEFNQCTDCIMKDTNISYADINLTIEDRVLLGIGLALYLETYPQTAAQVEPVMKKIIDKDLQAVYEKLGPPPRPLPG